MKLKHLLHATVALWVSLALPHSPASAGVPPAELIQYGMPPSLAQFAANISASEGDWTSVNWAGCVGAFQFCSGTLEQYYHGTREQFLNDPRAQVQAHLSYLADEWALVQRHGYSELIGQQVCYNGRCATITASSLLKACQFGCGPDGKLANFLNLSDCDHPKVRDGNNYSVCNYLISGAGYDVSHIIGEQENGIEGIGSIAAGMCLQIPIMSQAGEKATSPFGVDRTGRASVGYHLGLDLINSVGRGDSIYAGVPGRVIVARNSWCQKALSILGEEAEPTTSELQLQLSLATSMMYSLGNVEAVGGVLDRGLQIASALGKDDYALELLAGRNLYHTRRGEFAAALRDAERFAALARELDDPKHLVTADYILGIAYNLVGKQALSRRTLESGWARGQMLGLRRVIYCGYDTVLRTHIKKTVWSRLQVTLSIARVVIAVCACPYRISQR